MKLENGPRTIVDPQVNFEMNQFYKHSFQQQLQQQQQMMMSQMLHTMANNLSPPQTQHQSPVIHAAPPLTTTTVDDEAIREPTVSLKKPLAVVADVGCLTISTHGIC